jgi:exopolysaccharide production protein ExoZ
MAERAGKLKVPAFLTFLGDASYSIYLIHSAFISAAVVVLNKLGALDYLGAKPVYFILVIAATTAGCIGYVLIEKPLLARLSKTKWATKE